MGSWQKVGREDAFAEGSLTLVRVGARDLVAGRTRRGVFVVDSLCPHRGGPLEEGQIVDESVVCPWHAWEFDARTGICSRFPHTKLNTYETRIVDGDVLVRLDQNEGENDG